MDRIITDMCPKTRMNLQIAGNCGIPRFETWGLWWGWRGDAWEGGDFVHRACGRVRLYALARPKRLAASRSPENQPAKVKQKGAWWRSAPWFSCWMFYLTGSALHSELVLLLVFVRDSHIPQDLRCNADMSCSARACS